MPSDFASSLRAIMHPSLLDKTTIGSFSSFGLKTLSHETKKLFQSTRANI